jgi:preprotein translocase subunit SecG
MHGLFTFLLIIQALVAVVMITVILMQRSEGGGLTGGSPSGLMTARGAADFLTRTTSVSATIFVCLSIVLAAVAAGSSRGTAIDTSAARPTTPAAPLATPGINPVAPAVPAPAAPQQNQSNGVPLAQ